MKMTSTMCLSISYFDIQWNQHDNNNVHVNFQASQIDVELVRCTALRVIFDMLHLHGLEVMQRGRPDDETSSNSTATDSVLERQDSTEDGSSGAAGAKLVAILCAFLDEEVCVKIQKIHNVCYWLFFIFNFRNIWLGPMKFNVLFLMMLNASTLINYTCIAIMKIGRIP